MEVNRRFYEFIAEHIGIIDDSDLRAIEELSAHLPGRFVPKTEAELKEEKKKLEQELKKIKKCSEDKKKLMKYTIDKLNKMKKAKTGDKENILKKLKETLEESADPDGICCPKCKKCFSRDGRLPKVQKCGDTICEECSKSRGRFMKCPVCNKRNDTRKTTDNFSLQSILC